MAFVWIAVVLMVVCIGANAAIRDVITQWPNCTYLGEDNFREDLKLEFLLKLFSHDSLKDELASLKYDCGLEGTADSMILDPDLREGISSDLKGYVFRTTFTRPEGSESEGEIMDLAATTMKNAFRKKGSTSEFGCHYGKEDGEHVVVCVFFSGQLQGRQTLKTSVGRLSSLEMRCPSCCCCNKIFELIVINAFFITIGVKFMKPQFSMLLHL